MGVDISTIAEVNVNGKWEKVRKAIFRDGFVSSFENSPPSYSTDPFDWRSYSMFGFFADVKNLSQVTPLAPLKGFPSDSVYLNMQDVDFWDSTITMGKQIRDEGYYGLTYYTLEELLAFNYDDTFYDMRPKLWTTEEALEKGNLVTYREFLGQSYFDCLETLKTLGKPSDVRVIMWFK